MLLRNVLKSSLGIEPCERLKEAAIVPFRSLQMGIDGDADDLSVGNLEAGLSSIERNFGNLPAKHLPVPRSTNAPLRSWVRSSSPPTHATMVILMKTPFSPCGGIKSKPN